VIQKKPRGLRTGGAIDAQNAARDMALREALRTWQWYALWAMLFLNTLAGISIISQAAPMAQEIAKSSAATAAGLVGIISIANAAGDSCGPGSRISSGAAGYFL